MRTSTITRRTAETDIRLTLNLDGTGAGDIDTGCGFMNHMLTLLAKHARFDLTVRPSATWAASGATAARSCRWTRR